MLLGRQHEQKSEQLQQAVRACAGMCQVMEVYQPGAIVVCGGADSLSGDRLGCFNLSLQGHAHCMDFLAKFGVPMLVLGGGGYTMRNVARCWCYETGRMLAEELPDEYAPRSTPRHKAFLLRLAWPWCSHRPSACS